MIGKKLGGQTGCPKDRAGADLARSFDHNTKIDEQDSGNCKDCNACEHSATWQLFKNFRSAADGNISTMAAFLLPVLIVSSGVAADYSFAVRQSSKIQQVTDAAILASVSAASQHLKQKPNSSRWKEVAEIEFDRILKANINLRNIPAKITPALQYDNVSGQISGTASYDAMMETSLMRIVGVKQLQVSGLASATSALPRNIRVNFLIDISGSMGIGSTTSDQQKMVNEVNCAFACHYNDVYGFKNQLAQVRATSARLRIDEAKDAAIDIVKSLQNNPLLSSGNLEIGIYPFSNSLIDVLPGTTNLQTAINTLSNLEITNANLQGGSNLYYSLEQFATQAPQGGNGFSNNEKQTFSILITDGVQARFKMQKLKKKDRFKYVTDTTMPTTNPKYVDQYGLRYQMFYADACNPVKQSNHQFIVLNLEYLTNMVGYNGGEVQFFKKNKSQIDGELARCASQDSYFSGSSPAEIEAAVSEIKKALVKPTTLLTN